MQDNYKVQAESAKARFLSYDQAFLAAKHHLKEDEAYLYLTFLGEPYRISRKTGNLSLFRQNVWHSADSHGEIMTILDLLCDSREDRHISGRLKNMQDFGHQFHRDLQEKDPNALFFDACPDRLKAGCQALGGVPFPQGDIAYTVPVFEDLSVTLQFWLGDEEFMPRLRYLWDENALEYLKYETMYFAVDALIQKIKNG